MFYIVSFILSLPWKAIVSWQDTTWKPHAWQSFTAISPILFNIGLRCFRWTKTMYNSPDLFAVHTHSKSNGWYQNTNMSFITSHIFRNVIFHCYMSAFLHGLLPTYCDSEYTSGRILKTVIDVLFWLYSWPLKIDLYAWVLWQL